MRPGILATLALLLACSEEQGVARAGSWEFKVDTTPSSAGDGPRQTAWLRGSGTEGPRGEQQSTATVLSFDCRPDHTGAAILTEQALRQGSIEVELTLDAEEPRRIPAFAGTTPTGGQVILSMPLDSVLLLLEGRRQATIDYEDGAGSSPTTAVFPLAGLETYRDRFLEACDGKGVQPR
ncbi:MAG TPA: hypothetical protein VHG35_15265 [Gemmatimonadales bacterium]|nr:hypothetical protein [Gemmatimonadales bacterium]